jgi:hypothetical protein
MTILAFLLSLAVIDAILRRTAPPREDKKQAWARRFYAQNHVTPNNPASLPGLSGPAAMPGLGRLCEAIERQELPAGPAPVPGPAPETPVPQKTRF